MIKAIIFDLDGTLVNLPIDYSLIRKNLQILFHTNNKLKPLLSSIIDLCKNNESLLKEALSIICKEEERATENLVIIQNSFDTLKKLQNQGVLIILMTLQCQSIVTKIISKYDLNNIFSYIITRDDDIDRHSQIKKILDEMSISHINTLVIGDRLDDVLSAEKIGCSSILFNPSGKKIENIPRNTIEIKNLSKLKHLIK